MRRRRRLALATAADNERRWREAMERLSVETVQLKIAYGNAEPQPDAKVRNIVTELPLPTRAFVEAWLADKDAADRKRRARTDFWTLLFAAVAAAPIIWGIIVPWVRHAIVWLWSVAMTLVQ
jgi:hypothetical protein